MEEDLITWLIAGPDVAAFAQTRVWPVVRPQGSALPAITVNRTGGAEGQTFDGGDGLVDGALQIHCWGKTYSEAKRLARAAAARAKAWAGEGVQAAFVESEHDFDPERTEFQIIFRTIIDLRVWRQA